MWKCPLFSLCEGTAWVAKSCRKVLPNLSLGYGTVERAVLGLEMVGLHWLAWSPTQHSTEIFFCCWFFKRPPWSFNCSRIGFNLSSAPLVQPMKLYCLLWQLEARGGRDSQAGSVFCRHSCAWFSPVVEGRAAVGEAPLIYIYIYSLFSAPLSLFIIK